MAWRPGLHALLWGTPRADALSPGGGRLAQRESASFTPRRSLVRSQYRPQHQASSEAPCTGLIVSGSPAGAVSSTTSTRSRARRMHEQASEPPDGPDDRDDGERFADSASRHVQITPEAAEWIDARDFNCGHPDDDRPGREEHPARKPERPTAIGPAQETGARADADGKAERAGRPDGCQADVGIVRDGGQLGRPFPVTLGTDILRQATARPADQVPGQAAAIGGAGHWALPRAGCLALPGARRGKREAETRASSS